MSRGGNGWGHSGGERIGGYVPPIYSTKGGGSSKPPKKGCCPMVAAMRSVKRGKFRLARRYAAMSVRLMAVGAPTSD